MGKMNKHRVVDLLLSEEEGEEEYLLCRAGAGAGAAVIKKPRNFDKKKKISIHRYLRQKANIATINDKFPTTTEDVRADKPGRRCVSCSSSDATWLVFLDETTTDFKRECFIWNRLTHERIDLPNFPDPYGHDRSLYYKCVLYCNQESRDDTRRFKVTFCMKNGCTLVWATPSLSKWAKTDYFNHDVREVSRFCDIVAINYPCRDGNTLRLCAVSLNGVLVYESTTRAMRGNIVPGADDVRYERRLVNYHDTALFLLQRHPNSAWEVWKRALCKSTWERYSSGKDEEKGLVFFTSRGYSATYPRSPTLQQNCICYTEEGDNDNLYVFWLADQTLSVFKNHPNSGFPYCFPKSQTIPWLSFLEDKNVTVDDEEEAYKITTPLCLEERKDDICCHELMVSGDILSLVAESLHNGADYANFRGVCKMWRGIARPRCWKPDISSTTTPFKLFPWLMTLGNQDNDSQSFLDPTSNMRYYLDDKELSGCKVQYSKDGWLLVTRGAHTIFFYEPFSKSKIYLVDLPEAFRSIDGMSFSSTPTSPDWVVLVQRSPRRDLIYSLYLTSGAEAWDIVESEIDFKKNRICSTSSSLFHDHKFYSLGQDGSLLTIDLRGDALSESAFRTVENSARSNDELVVSGSGYLVSCENELYRVVIGSLGRSIRVYKLKNDRPESEYISWDEVKSVNEYAFFVSKTSSFAIPVTENAHKNSINFPLLAENCCLSYKLELSEFKSFDGDSLDGSGIFGRKELFGGTWIQPKVLCAYR